MEIVLATHHLGLGGSESYLVTVAEQLQRLGHRVRLRAAQLGAGTAPARERGLRVEGPEADLPKCDAVIVQDAAMTYACARALPSVPRVFVAHSELFDAQLPPQQPGLVNVVVVLNARSERRVRALGRVPEVVRLRQPIDTERFAAREVIRARPARALVLSNYVHGQRLELLRDAWKSRGITCELAGAAGEQSVQPEVRIADADIVVGKGRALLEGMACARAAYLYDIAGSDGWVTPERYGAMEADGFAGQAFATTPSGAALGADLDRYTAAMGVQNRDLVLAGHGARRHAEQLVELLSRLVPTRRAVATALPELERLTAAQWRLESRAAGLGRENELLHRRVLELERAHAELRATRRYRAAAALGSMADRLRRVAR